MICMPKSGSWDQEERKRLADPTTLQFAESQS